MMTTVNEKISTGRKFRRLIDRESKLWMLISWWTKATDVEFNDGRTAEQKVGNINGITNDLDSTRDDLAASISAAHNINEELHYRIGTFRIFKGEDGYIYIVDESEGADAVPKKLGDGDPEILNSGSDNEYLFAEDTSHAYCLKTGTKDIEKDGSIHVGAQDATTIAIKLPDSKYVNVRGGNIWQDEASGMSLTNIYSDFARTDGGGGVWAVRIFLLKNIPAGTMIKSKIKIFK